MINRFTFLIKYIARTNSDLTLRMVLHVYSRPLLTPISSFYLCVSLRGHGLLIGPLGISLTCVLRSPINQAQAVVFAKALRSH